MQGTEKGGKTQRGPDLISGEMNGKCRMHFENDIGQKTNEWEPHKSDLMKGEYKWTLIR